MKTTLKVCWEGSLKKSFKISAVYYDMHFDRGLVLGLTLSLTLPYLNPSPNIQPDPNEYHDWGIQTTD